MDHKITVQTKSRKNTWIILILTLVVIALGVFLYIFYTGQKASQAAVAARIAAGQPSVSSVESGPMKLVIEDISGTVRSNQSVDLAWKTSGTVAAVNVSVGDSVKQGDILAELDPKTLSIQVQNAQVELDDAKDDMEKLTNNAEATTSAVTELVKAQQELDDAQKAYDSLDPSRAWTDAVQLAYETYLKAQNDYESALAKFEVTRDYPIDDATRIKRLGDVGGYRSVRDNALAEYRRYLGEGNEMERLIREAALQLAKATLEEKQYQYDKVTKGPTEAEINAAQAKIDAAQQKLNSSKLIAPFSGVVTQLETKVNDVISETAAASATKTTAIRIEDLSTFYIDTTVNELDVNSIQPGQAAEIQFIGIPDKTYHGTVTTVADTGISSGRSVTFNVTLKIDDADELVKSGMTADLSMTIANIPETLYVPLSSVLLKNGQPSVNLKKTDGSFEWIPIETGLVSGTKVQVLSDNLKAGDEIEADVNVDSTDTNDNPMFPMGFGGRM
ncbi:MAG TPA: efflux RND transporter periplasmic adaptor subunit [Flexilinea sp.]|nr:efflux RND transporter periplasmic adaptor subunit [Flexilinea sp.]HOW06468.1 efflux RND transporter periplasmic adaptor subunit [Flexilinea sp.]HPS48269.1 efflux RND transporter periplasmic adaptor subunit [Flexilinea sp.]